MRYFPAEDGIGEPGCSAELLLIADDCTQLMLVFFSLLGTELDVRGEFVAETGVEVYVKKFSYSGTLKASFCRGGAIFFNTKYMNSKKVQYKLNFTDMFYIRCFQIEFHTHLGFSI